MSRNSHLVITSLISLLICNQSYSLDSDQYKPCTVHSKSIYYYRNQGKTIYIKNVVADQGTTHIEGDKVIVYTKPSDNKVNKIIAYGHPAHYHTLPNGKKKPVFAQADTIQYYPRSKKVLLLRHGKVIQQHNVFTGPHIWYDMKHQVVKSTTHGSSKTTVIIQPQQTQ